MTVQTTILTYDGLRRHARMDKTSGGLVVVDEAHITTHDGWGFSIAGYADLALNAVYDIQITTPDTTKWIHLFWSMNVESETYWAFYENPDIILAGTALSIVNHNRNSSNVSNATIKGIANSSVANANLDTDVSGATLLEEGIVGSGNRIAGSRGSIDEFFLKQNEDYVIRFVANTAGYVNWQIDIHEWTDLE